MLEKSSLLYAKWGFLVNLVLSAIIAPLSNTLQKNVEWFF